MDRVEILSPCARELSVLLDFVHFVLRIDNRASFNRIPRAQLLRSWPHFAAAENRISFCSSLSLI